MWPPAEVIVSSPSRRACALLGLVLPLVAVPYSAAQERPPGAAGASTAPVDSRAPLTRPARDPFRTRGQPARADVVRRAASDLDTLYLPDMALRALIRLAGGPPAALLQVGDGAQVVRQGESFDVIVEAPGVRSVTMVRTSRELAHERGRVAAAAAAVDEAARVVAGEGDRAEATRADETIAYELPVAVPRRLTLTVEAIDRSSVTLLLGPEGPRFVVR